MDNGLRGWRGGSFRFARSVVERRGMEMVWCKASRSCLRMTLLPPPPLCLSLKHRHRLEPHHQSNASLLQPGRQSPGFRSCNNVPRPNEPVPLLRKSKPANELRTTKPDYETGRNMPTTLLLTSSLKHETISRKGIPHLDVDAVRQRSPKACRAAADGNAGSRSKKKSKMAIFRKPHHYGDGRFPHLWSLIMLYIFSDPDSAASITSLLSKLHSDHLKRPRWGTPTIRTLPRLEGKKVREKNV